MMVVTPVPPYMHSLHGKGQITPSILLKILITFLFLPWCDNSLVVLGPHPHSRGL